MTPALHHAAVNVLSYVQNRFFLIKRRTQEVGCERVLLERASHQGRAPPTPPTRRRCCRCTSGELRRAQWKIKTQVWYGHWERLLNATRCYQTFEDAVRRLNDVIRHYISSYNLTTLFTVRFCTLRVSCKNCCSPNVRTFVFGWHFVKHDSNSRDKLFQGLNWNFVSFFFGSRNFPAILSATATVHM